MLAGDNSILHKATTAKENTDNAQTREELQIAITGASVDYYTGNKSGTLRDYLFSSEGQAKIKSGLGTDDVTFNTSNHTITYKGVTFEIAADGTVLSSKQIASTDTGNIEPEELPDDFWIASEGVAYINTKYIDFSESSSYGGSGSGSGSYSGSGSGSYSGSGSGSGSYGGTPAVQVGACQYTKLTVPSTINGETVTKFSVANVNNIVLLDVQEGINDIPSLSTLQGSLEKMIVPKKDITKEALNGKLSTDFGEEEIGYTISNSDDNKQWIVTINIFNITVRETESRAAVVSVVPTISGRTKVQDITLTFNGEPVSPCYTYEGVEFGTTKNGNYTLTVTLRDGKTENKTVNVAKCKIEEYSPIQNSNYTLRKDGYEVVIPAGFAYGTSENVGTVTTGLVITDSVETVEGKNYSNGNEFVWIPVDKTNLTVGKTNKKMAEIASGTNYRGVLYNWEMDQTGNTTYQWSTSSEGKREPDALSYDSSYGIKTTTMQNEYDSMIASIKRYGGFYVARYEMGEGASNISRLNVMPYNNIKWYTAYSSAKSYNKAGVTSGMIWGSQWDAMLNFGLTNSSDSAKVVANTNGNHNNTILKTGIWLGTTDQTDKINNIIDLEGNVKEWTMEADNSDYDRRTIRGLSSRYSYRLGASCRGSYFPSNSEDTYIYGDYFATRVSLYINVPN